MNDEQSRIYCKQNTITTQSRDGFANETVSREGFAGFVKPVSNSTNRLHKTQKSETGFGYVSQIEYGLIEMMFGIWTLVGPRNCVLHGCPSDMGWGNFVVEKGLLQDMPGHVQVSIYWKQHNGAVPYDADAGWGIGDGVHIGATWQIQLNCLYVVVMWYYVKLLWPLVNFLWYFWVLRTVLPCR